MAQLRDLTVNGASRLIGDAYVNNIQINSILAHPNAEDSTTYTSGTSNQVLQTDGTKVYWGQGIDSNLFVHRAGDTMTGSLTLNLEDNNNDKHLILNQGDAILNNSAIIISDTANGAPNKSFISFDKTNSTSWKIYNSTTGHLTIAAQSAGVSGYIDRIRLEGNSSTSVLIIDNLKVNNTPQSADNSTIDTFYLPVFQADNSTAITTANPGTLQVMKPKLSSEWVNGTTTGPQHIVTLNGMSTSATAPVATTTQSGVVTTTNQFFKGHKISTSAFTVGSLTANNVKAAGIYMDPLGNITLSSTTPTLFFKRSTTSTVDAKIDAIIVDSIRISPHLLVGTSATHYKQTATYSSVSAAYACVINNHPNKGLYVNNDVDVIGKISACSTSTNGTFFSGYNNTTALFNVTYNISSSSTYTQAKLGAGNIKGVLTLTTTGGNMVSLTGAYDTTHNHHISTGVLVGTQIWGAVWNDYAEFRETKNPIEPGRCIIETGNGDLVLSTERLQNGAEIISDTYGFAIGQTEKCNTPIASNGRVLAYLYEDAATAKRNVGQPVCSGPNGTVSIMTDKEARDYPWKIIGTISEIPNYDKWQIGKLEDNQFIEVNNRIWIRIR